MSDTQPQAAEQAPVAPTPKQNLANIEAVRDLFARSHDYIAQASHPGHMGMKVAEVLNFLKFHYEDFKLRGEKLAKMIEADAKAEASKVDIAAAKAKVAEVLGNSIPTTAVETPATPTPTTDAPKA